MSHDLTIAAELQPAPADCLRGCISRSSGGRRALGFEFEGALCSMRAVTLAPGLDVLSLTCVLAWDRPLKAHCTSASPTATTTCNSAR